MRPVLKKRALIVTYDYPPCSAPGAAVRSQKLVQYLPEFGWDTWVLCRKEHHLESGAQPNVTRIPTPVSPRFSYQLGAWMWAKRLRSESDTLMREWRPDLIYASGPPFPHALAAIRLARNAGVPLAVDFRDSWSLDPHRGGGFLKQSVKSSLCRWVYPKLERTVIDAADAVIMNTDSMRRAYAHRLRIPEQRIHLVPNGFDESDFGGDVQRPARPKLELLYCGRFAGIGGRSPEFVLKAVGALAGKGRELELVILGEDSEALRRNIQRLGIEAHVRSFPPVSNSEAARRMQLADALVVYQAPSQNEVTPIAGKTFEDLRSGRPILAIVPPGDKFR